MAAATRGGMGFNQLANLGVQLFDLVSRLTIAGPGSEDAFRMFQQLLLEA